MSFVYGGTDTRTLAGATATLSEWPSLGGLSVETTDIPGRDGRSFGGVSRTHSTFVFDVVISGETPQETASRRDNFVGMLDPSRGPQDLVVETDTAWLWRDVLASGPIDWSRFTWERGLGFVLRADVTLETVGDPSAREVADSVVAGPSPFQYTLDVGNTRARPSLRFVSGGDFDVTVGAFSVQLTGTPSGVDAVLDYDAFEFYTVDGSGIRTGSLVRHMSHYERPSLLLGDTVTVSVTQDGSDVSMIELKPNARRA